ncbi:MAG TPA: hypothetical protein VGL86_32185 [Polyangia bacterium]|jgi:CheY-like chemotaxis protein
MQRTIVLVDEGSPARAEVDEILDGAGYRAQIAPTGRAALTMMCALDRPVVLVLASRLPDMSAREFIAHLADDARLADAVMVMVANGHADAGELAAALTYAFAEADRRGARVPISRRRPRATALKRRARSAPPG